MALHRGTLIVLEGLDRSGKSTQCARLATHLTAQGHKVTQMRFPDRGTPIGRMINSYLSGQAQVEDHVIHLLFSANRWEAAAEIKRLINSGTTVVIDRYFYSGCVYSAAKQIPGMDLYWCRQPEVGLPQPDACIFLDVDAETAMCRGGYGAERYETQEVQSRVRELFLQLRGQGEDIMVIDASGSVEEVGAEITELVEGVMEVVRRESPLLS